jgi:hypothetical protein
MIVSVRALPTVALFGFLAAVVAVAGCSGGVNTTPVSTTTTPSGSTASFATIAGPPTTLSAAAAAVAVPSVAGTTSVGGSVMIASASGGTAVVTVASVTTSTGAGGPPVLLSSVGRRGAQDFNGTTITPVYYVGVTNTGTSPTTVTIPTLTFNVTVGAGQSTGLAHYDPTQPQNGWNQHCAFGTGQVNTNGNTTTYTPGGTGNAQFTLYPGATLWFAPYTYSSSNTAVPTAPPVAPTTAPTSAPPPSSLTGTYVGSAQQTSPSQQASQYLEISLTQTGSSVSGTMGVLPASSTEGGFFGPVSGSISNGTLSLSATPQYGGSCPATINGTASGMLISGTFSSPACAGGNSTAVSGTFSAVLQSGSLPTLSGTYNGTIKDSTNGSGTISLAVTTPGTVFSGTGTVSYPSNPSANGTSAFVGFVSSATSATFAIIGSGGSNNNNNNGGNCQPFGTLTIASGANSFTGTYTNSGSSNGSCSGTGTFSVSH